MNWLPYILLKERGRFWKMVDDNSLGLRDLYQLILFIVFSSAMYGAVLAGWRSPLLSLYVAVKLPLLFLGTTAIVAVFNWMIATLLGSGLSFKSTLFVVFGAMTIGAWLLLAMVPIAMLFMITGVPDGGTEAQLQYAHNAMLMTHIVILALAGFYGNTSMYSGLRLIVRERCPRGLLFFIWLLAFAFVGCQLSWILRPFIGSPFFPVEFIRPDALDRNFYQFIFGEVLPYLFK